MALVGDLNRLRDLKRSLKSVPVTAVAEIAKRSAPAVTAHAQASFRGGQDVFGAPRLEAVQGGNLSLVKSGATQAAIQFIATGRDIRVARLPRYAKYLIGRYGILPNGKQLPNAWRGTIGAIAKAVLDKGFEQ